LPEFDLPPFFLLLPELLLLLFLFDCCVLASSALSSSSAVVVVSEAETLVGACGAGGVDVNCCALSALGEGYY